MTEHGFTQKAQGVLTQAVACAMELGHDYVGSEHLLIGILRESACPAARILNEAGVTRERATMLLKKMIPTGEPLTVQPRGLTARGREIVELSFYEARRLGMSSVSSEHILLAMLRESECSGTRIVRGAGVDPRRVYLKVVAACGRAGREEMEGMSTPGVRKSHNVATPLLSKYGRDLTADAMTGRIDELVGRDEEVSRVIQILSRRSKNNPCLIGEPGVGKTAIAEGLAVRMVQGRVPDFLQGQRLITLELSSMVAGAKYRGEFEDRLKGTMEEIRRAGNIILFIDELHTIVGAGAAEGAIDAANILKPTLARGEFRVMGATTLAEYHKYIEKDAALERRFQPVLVQEPTVEQTMHILEGISEKYELHHGVTITKEALEAAVRLSVRYLPDRYLPDKAIDLMDEAAARIHVQAEQETALAACMPNGTEVCPYKSRTVTAEEVAQVVGQCTGIPVSRIDMEERQRMQELELRLNQQVIGQPQAVAAVTRAVRRSRTGLRDPKRPVGSFLFLGPTGVGKTLLCRTLSACLFDREDALIRVDMSEYMEAHSVSKIIGSPPGYVGHEEGGQLCQRLRRQPYCVLLLDEIEKAHPDVFHLLLQMLEDGHLTDAQGRQVDLRNAVIIMTSNVGARHLTQQQMLGFLDGAEEQDRQRKEKRALQELKQLFRPELLGRIDEIMVFHPLGKKEMQCIGQQMIKTVQQRAQEQDIDLQVEPAALEWLAEHGYDQQYGARPLRRLITAQVEDVLAEKMLSGEAEPGSCVRLMVDHETLCMKVTAPSVC